MSLSRSLDLPALDKVDTLAQELALLQDKGKRRIAILGSRHVPIVAIHLVELIARSLAQEGHSLVTSGAQGVNAAVIRGVLEVDPSKLTVLLLRAWSGNCQRSRKSGSGAASDRKTGAGRSAVASGQQSLQSRHHQPLRPVDLSGVSTVKLC